MDVLFSFLYDDGYAMLWLAGAGTHCLEQRGESAVRISARLANPVKHSEYPTKHLYYLLYYTLLQYKQ